MLWLKSQLCTPSKKLRAGLATTLALGLLTGIAGTAHAQDRCETEGGVVLPPDWGELRRTFPSAGASSVPRNAPVRLRFVGRAPPRPFVSVTALNGGASVNGVVSLVSGDSFVEVIFQPSTTLASMTTYEARFATLNGEDSFTFTTGTALAPATAPQFGGVVSAKSERNGSADLCGDLSAVTVTTSWVPSLNPGWPEGDLEYVVYQTRGFNIGGPVERARGRVSQAGVSCGTRPDTERCVSFRLTTLNASEPVCFNVQVVDPLGRNDGNNVEKCINPSAGNYFEGCSVSGRTVTRRPASLAAWLLASVTAIALVRRRRSNH